MEDERRKKFCRDLHITVRDWERGGEGGRVGEGEREREGERGGGGEGGRVGEGEREREGERGGGVGTFDHERSRISAVWP